MLQPVEHAIVFEEHEEAAALGVEARLFDVRVDPDRTDRDVRQHARGRTLAGQLVEPVEGLGDFGGAETGLDQASLERIAVADGVGVVVEIVFEQVEQYVQYGLFHPLPGPPTRRGVGRQERSSA